MFSLALRRLATAVPTLLVVITVAFFMMRAAPGGPFDEERALPEQIRRNIDAYYHLDRHLLVQYFEYLLNVLRGDLGPSFKVRDFTVNELLASGLPVSLRLGGSAILLALVIGASLGALAALRQNRLADHAVMAVAMTGITLPNFVVAPLLTLLFGVYLHWLPVAGWQSATSAVLPIVALALPQIAYIARLTRGSMIEVLGANYIRTARAKGLGERITVLRHALKPALLPVVSYLGPAAAGLMTGSVVIESIFDIPGVGRHFVKGALNRDYTLVMGTVILFGGFIILFNLLVDLAYGWLDPKVRQS